MYVGPWQVGLCWRVSFPTSVSCSNPQEYAVLAAVQQRRDERRHQDLAALKVMPPPTRPCQLWGSQVAIRQLQIREILEQRDVKTTEEPPRTLAGYEAGPAEAQESPSSPADYAEPGSYAGESAPNAEAVASALLAATAAAAGKERCEATHLDCPANATYAMYAAWR
eukprot:scaffold2420_cov259-Pinguiococcus_pyrenoidosus.AAC.15